jgi:glycosyltransferase involved in cell wall biosynthesis
VTPHRHSRCPPLLVFSDPWGRHPSSCQHLIRHLLRRTCVTWVEVIGMRRWRWDRHTLRRGLEQLRRWWHASVITAPPHSAPQVLRPRLWPSFRSRWARSFNAAQLLRLLPVTHQPPVVLTTLPLVADLVGRFPARRWIYYCLDDYSAWPGWDGPTLRRCENALLPRIDRLILVNPLLGTRFAPYRLPTLLLTHGVDLEHFRNPTSSWQPPPHIPPPWIIYWGLIDTRLDLSMLHMLSLRLRESSHPGSILLIGPREQPPPDLTQLPNLYILPKMDYQTLPAVGAAAHVLIAPYRNLPVTQAMQPLKFLEYLATGKPVVARRLPALLSWSDAADLVDTPDHFATCVLERLHTGLPPHQLHARRRLHAETWHAKAELLEHWLFSD